MTIDLKRYNKLKEQVDSRQRETDRAEGALAQTMKELEADWDCKTLEEAEGLLKEKREESEVLSEKFQRALDKFEKRWAKELGVE